MDVFEYIVRLEKSELTAVLEVLYSNEWTTVAVFRCGVSFEVEVVDCVLNCGSQCGWCRSVPPLAQHIILRLLYTSNLRQDKDSFKAWVSSVFVSFSVQSLQQLLEYHLHYSFRRFL